MKTILILALISVFVLAGCSTGNVIVEKKQTEEPIKMGFIGPLSGDVSSIGQATRNSVQMAVDEINEAGGINGKRISAYYEDGKCLGKDSSNVAHKLINVDGVDYIIGGLCSSETMAATSIAEENQVVMISPCSSNPDITNAGDFIFRDYPSDSFQGKFAAEYAYNDLGVRKAAVLSCLSDWCYGLKEVFNERFTGLGGEIVEIQEFKQKSKDLRAQLTKIKNTDAELIFFPAYTESTVNGFKQAKELGIGKQFLGSETWTDPVMLERAGNEAEGTIYVQMEKAAPESFRQKYEEKFGEQEIPICVLEAYDAVRLIANAIEKVGNDPVKVKDELYNVQDYEGVSGKISFDENGDLKEVNYSVVQIKNGEPVKIG